MTAHTGSCGAGVRGGCPGPMQLAGAQMGQHAPRSPAGLQARAHNPKVAGSNPAPDSHLRQCRGTALVPDASSDMPDASRAGDGWDGWDASGRIWHPCSPAGGRAVAGSNPVSPITGIPLGKRVSTLRGAGAELSLRSRGTSFGTETGQARGLSRMPAPLAHPGGHSSREPDRQAFHRRLALIPCPRGSWPQLGRGRRGRKKSHKN
jgi:hypothetical protein